MGHFVSQRPFEIKFVAIKVVTSQRRKVVLIGNLILPLPNRSPRLTEEIPEVLSKDDHAARITAVEDNSFRLEVLLVGVAGDKINVDGRGIIRALLAIDIYRSARESLACEFVDRDQQLAS